MSNYIQKISISVCLLLGLYINAQSNDKNYISTKAYQVAVTETELSTLDRDSVIQSVSYFDGLGRPIQNIEVRAGGNREDIIVPMYYDQYGRSSSEHLPFSQSNNNGDFIEYASDLSDEYLFDTHFDIASRRVQKTFYKSPLHRIQSQAMPMDRSARTSNLQGVISYEYALNTTNDNISKYHVSYEDSDNIIDYHTYLNKDANIYGTGTLYKSITKDENWIPSMGQNHTVEEYTNTRGQIVLKRTFNDNISHDTYYVYDEHLQLSFVIPPLAAKKTILSETDINELCYQYLYDEKGRLRKKKIPGKGWEYIVYDTLDRPILTQDANLRTDNKWLFTKYDDFNRAVYTGIYVAETDQGFSTLQQLADDATEVNECRTQPIEVRAPRLSKSTTTCGVSQTIDGTLVHYTNNVFPQEIDQLLTINYYDTYNNMSNLSFLSEQPFEQEYLTTPTGLAVVTKTRVLDTNQWINENIGYDRKGRPVAILRTNEYLDTYELTHTLYDFTGKVLKNKLTHRKGNSGDYIYSLDEYTYDHIGRLNTHHHKIDNKELSDTAGNYPDIISVTENPTNNTDLVATERIIISPNTTISASTSNAFTARIEESSVTSELIVDNTYNGLGQLESKDVGNKVNKPLQSVDYRYNEQGWLSGINNHSQREEDDLRDISTIAMGAGDLFGMQINYSHPTAEATPLYNGNISQIHWRTASEDASQKTYNYEYDALNRITKAEDNTSKYNLNSVSYDQNGNILSLNRSGHTNANASSFGIMDDLTYTYKGNQLLSVTDITGSIYGFKDGNTSEDDYDYDDNGNMVMDKNKGISQNNPITYNHLNLPKKVTVNHTNYIEYIYDANGTKIEKKVGPYGNITHYTGNYIYETIGGAGTFLKFMHHPEGYVEPKNQSNLGDGFNYVYQHKDHLGNIRLSYTDTNDDYEQILSSSFVDRNNLEGWQPNGSASISGFPGSLIARVQNSWAGVKHLLNNEVFVPGEQLTVYCDFDKSSTNANVRLYIQELDSSGSHLSWNTLDGNLQTGNHQYEYTVKTGTKLVLRVDKNNTHLDETTSFVIHEIGLTRGALEIKEEKNYYPFGLQHKGYNNTIVGQENNYQTFQGQEHTEDLGLNIHEWNYRVSDPTIGRFWQIDPLAEKYHWMTTYQFSSNQPIHAPELEGLESSYDLNSRDPNLQNLTPSERTAYKKGLRNGTATGTDFIPLVGDVKGVIETFTGSDLISGQQLSLGARLLGLIGLSELRTIGKIGDTFRGLKVLGESSSLAGFEKTVTDVVIKNGDQIIAAGDLGVDTGKSLSAISLGIGGEKAADILSVSSSGKFNITEVKAITAGTISADQVGSAVLQLTNTANALKNGINAVKGAKIGTLNIAVPTGTKFGGVYSVSGNQLVRNTADGQQVVRVQGQVVNVRYVDQ
ncbi:DUF6443 domain-containing protein [Aquimarina aggregata]|uniref:DUF6443 domain-containing protein n=1 Tax=Aquimarina aggregata TaxID=1642818 RepID=UPI002490BA7A|nr:DUF6443 domain-containing protein [Aquimarina aggregata]